jgi:hypothetical protein
MPEFVQPTIWTLSNTAAGLQVSYSVAGPHLHYHHGPVIRDFTGSEIRLVEVPDLGTLVSVTILLTIDSGSTTFTLLLPRVNLPAPPALPALVPVTTEGDYDRPPLLRVPAAPTWATGVLHGDPTSRHSRLNWVFIGERAAAHPAGLRRVVAPFDL